MNRGPRGDHIFVDSDSCSLFLELLSEIPVRFGVRIHGFVLMPDHYHLMLETPHGNLSRAMRHLGSQYTRRLNNWMGWDGSVFRGRYRNRMVESDDYWQHLLAYLHLNPVRSRLVSDPLLARWTSHRHYAGKAVVPDWLSTKPILELFGGQDKFLAYVKGLQRGRIEPPEDFDPNSLWVNRQGVSRPVDETTGLVAPKVNLVPCEVALEHVCDVTAESREGLRESRRGRFGNRARWLAAWWLVHASGLAHREVGALLDGTVVGVSKWVRKINLLAETDAGIQGWLQQLEERRGNWYHTQARREEAV